MSPPVTNRTERVTPTADLEMGEIGELGKIDGYGAEDSGDHQVGEGTGRSVEPNDAPPVDRQAAPDDGPPGADQPADAATADSSDPHGGDQSWSWHAIRVSGLFLSILIPIHFCVTIIGGDVGATTAGTMFNRLRNTWWRGTEWIVIGLSLVHAVLAVRAALARSDLAPMARRRLAATTTVVGVALAAVVALFLITYH